MGISLENQQRAKCLTLPNQRQIRCEALHKSKMDVYKKEKELYNAELEIYERNEQCQMILVGAYKHWWNQRGLMIEDGNIEITRNLPAIDENALNFQQVQG